MTTEADHILLIEDDAGLAAALQRVLTEEGYRVTLEKRGDAGLELAQREAWDVVITDLKLPGLSGLELVRELHAAKPRLPIILMTAHGTTETAIEATKFGAYDYLLKPFEMDQLIELVEKSVAVGHLMSEPVGLGEPGTTRDAIIGRSRVMQEIYKEIGRVAAKPVTVLIRGETGTGKELIARALYQHSERAQEPFVAINCSAIPETLLESELFGHERGAFTGASERRIGRFEQANRGTIFLDEVGDMAPTTQVKLLRVLQEKCLQRVGGRETIPVDVRVIAATHRDLEAAMAQKQFREDLFYRLSVVVISLPPLRERKEDIPDLVRYFLEKYGREFGLAQPSIEAEALQSLQTQRWPGNVRQVENVTRNLLLLARFYPINAGHVRAALAKAEGGSCLPQQSLSDYIGELLAAAQRGDQTEVHATFFEQAERELFGQAILLAQGNQAKAARWLGVSRLTMREKLTHFGIRPTRDNPPES